MKAFLIGGAIAALASGIAIAQAAPPTPPGVAQGTAPLRPAPPRPPLAPLPPRPMQVRVQMMSNHVLTRDEIVTHVRAMFDRLDTNHDGYITRDEMSAIESRMAGMHDKMMGMHERMKTMRFNVEDRVDGGHPRVDRGAMFDRLDTNHDGVISRQEFMAARPQVGERRIMVMRDGGHMRGMPMPEMPKMHGERGMMMPMHGMGMGGMGAHLFEMADTNHDGRVSLHEAEAVALAHFDKADLNHDGKITPDERQQVRQIRTERRQS